MCCGNLEVSGIHNLPGSNTDKIIKKTQQRTNSLSFCKKFILCTLKNITVWFGLAFNRTRPDYNRHWGLQVKQTNFGADLSSTQDLYKSRVRKRAGEITADNSHPANNLFQLLPTGRRYRALHAKTSRHLDRLFPQAVTL